MKSDRTLLTRREALGAFGLLALAAHTGFAAAAGDKGKKPSIALQLYTMREEAKKDLKGTLKRVADMGWRNVQWSGMPKMEADQIRAALDAAGLKCVACHTDMESFEKKFDETVAFWKTVGCKDVAPGGMMNDCRKDVAAWKAGCKRLDVLGAKLRGVGMRLSFHNHQMEFEKFPGEKLNKYEILMAETKPENLAGELDIAWALDAGQDPAALIGGLLKNRCPVVHAKDCIPTPGKKGKLVPLGQGKVDWPAVFAAGRTAGIECYIYEQDNGEGSVWDYVQQSYNWLSKQAL